MKIDHLYLLCGAHRDGLTKEDIERQELLPAASKIMKAGAAASTSSTSAPSTRTDPGTSTSSSSSAAAGKSAASAPPRV